MEVDLLTRRLQPNRRRKVGAMDHVHDLGEINNQKSKNMTRKTSRTIRKQTKKDRDDVPRKKDLEREHRCLPHRLIDKQLLHNAFHTRRLDRRG